MPTRNRNRDRALDALCFAAFWLVCMAFIWALE